MTSLPPTTEDRRYPARPWLAVSAAVFRDGRVLLVRRARPPAQALFTLPGGAVEIGESLAQAVVREVLEETALTIRPVGLAGHSEVIGRDPDGRVERHFVVLAFAARWIAGEPVLDPELADAGWHDPAAVAALPTTDGLAAIVTAARALVASG